MVRPQVVFVLGGPGAGKGTQCFRIQEHFGFKHISAGDCLREERNNPSSSVGELINDHIREGKIVPVEITCSLLRNKMKLLGWEDGKFLIDGFPRNEDNLRGWKETMTDVDLQFCLFVDCSEEVMEQRLLRRAETSGRVDDNAESIRKRFQTYLSDTCPIIKRFEVENKCKQVDGAQDIETVHYAMLASRPSAESTSADFNGLQDLQISLRKTRRGQVRRIVREVYFRDDIYCGIQNCEVCDPIANSEVLTLNDNNKILIVDSTTAFTQVDFLCKDACVNNCVLMSSVLEAELSPSDAAARFHVFPDVISQNVKATRLTEEFQERRVRLAALWYMKHIELAFGLSDRVIFLTSTQFAKDSAKSMGLSAMTVFEYVDSVSALFPLAGEMLADSMDTQEGDVEPCKRQRVDLNDVSAAPVKKVARFEPHLGLNEIEVKIRMRQIFKGVIRMDRDSHVCGTVVTDAGSIRILGYKRINRAIDGDTVAIQLVEASSLETDKFILADEDDGGSSGVEESATSDQKAIPEPSPLSSAKISESLDSSPSLEGKVVGILKRHQKEYAGTLVPLPADQIGTRSAYVKISRIFRPWDSRIPDIVITTRQSSQLESKRLVVAVDGWEREHRLPVGHWTGILGDVDDIKSESKAITMEYDIITREFSDSVLRCLPPASYIIPPEEVARRQDFRDLLVCSIDPPGCKDIDDALSCQQLPNGTFRVGVHIADVTHFVLPSTAIDLEAAERCTTVYLVDQRTDMLPGLLTTDLCSLVANVDRLTFSVVWILSAEGQILDTQFHKGVIRSRRAFTYEEAQTLIENEADRSDLRKSILQLRNLAMKLRNKRKGKGALELASLEVKFQLESETHSPNDMGVYLTRETNILVEEFMLLANSSVAQFILDHIPRHPPPKEDQLKNLESLLAAAGVENFDYSSSKALAKSLDNAVRKRDPFFNKMVRVLTTRCMSQAVYVCAGDVEPTQVGEKAEASKFKHYGLAADLYTHFTSPIRRYADVLVHRLLAAALGLIPIPEPLLEKEKVSAQCDQMNIKHRNAQWAGRASVELFTYKYFKAHGEAEADALVISCKKNGMRVQIPRYGIEGIILTADKKEFSWKEINKQLHYCPEGNEEEGTPISVFDHVWVKIKADNSDHRPKTVLSFIELTPLNKFETEEDTKKYCEEFKAKSGLLEL